MSFHAVKVALTLACAAFLGFAFYMFRDGSKRAVVAQWYASAIEGIKIARIQPIAEPRVVTTIFQTTKSRLDMSPGSIKAHSTWRALNPDHTVFVANDIEMEHYMLTSWPPQMLRFWKALPMGVMRADIFRYAVVYTHGGVYSDIDSVCLQPVSKWDELLGEARAVAPDSAENLLDVALENDVHFCQWAFRATMPHHAAMRAVMGAVLQNFKDHNETIPLAEHFVHKFSGPGIWTHSLAAYLGRSGKTAREIFDEYQRNATVRAEIRSKGVRLHDQNTFAGQLVRNQFGSQAPAGFPAEQSWTREMRHMLREAREKK
jgi:hypothetical protein